MAATGTSTTAPSLSSAPLPSVNDGGKIGGQQWPSATAQGREEDTRSKNTSGNFFLWLRAIVVVVFDVDYGQKIERIFVPRGQQKPESSNEGTKPRSGVGMSLTEDEQKRICALSLPDANSGHNGDVQFAFRCRCSDFPLYASSPLENEYLYGDVFFRQIRNPNLSRGYFQKSIVIVSENPYSECLFRRCARIIGPLYFEFGDEVLDAVCSSIDSWPTPSPGISVDLPVAGTIIPCTVPVLTQGWNWNGPCSVPRRERDDVRGRGFGGNAPFSSVPLFSTFGSLSVSLWHMWELAITGEPMLILAQNPDCASRAVLAMLSLIAPVAYCGDFRPYFTIYDPDFDAVSSMHNERKGVKMPPTVIGATNPYFMKALEFWPNVISLGGALGGYTKGISAQTSREGKPLLAHKTKGKGLMGLKRLSMDSKMMRASQSSSRRGFGLRESKSVKGSSMRTAKYVPMVAKSSRSLRSLLTDHITNERSIILTRQTPLIYPDRETLSRLCPCGTSRGISNAESINNQILRDHFKSLTRTFLKPFDKYFRLGDPRTSSRTGPKGARVTVEAYSDPASLLLRFDEREFLTSLPTPTCPTLRASKWRHAYKMFLRGPNFRAWFNGRRKILMAEVTLVLRSLKMGTDANTLLRSCKSAAPTGNNARLYFRIKRALDAELSRPVAERDSELCEKMKEHLRIAKATLTPSQRDILRQRTRTHDGAIFCGTST